MAKAHAPVWRKTTSGSGSESPRTTNGIDRGQLKLSDARAEPQGYLAAIQTRGGRIQIISSRNHYVFNLAWLKALPVGP